MLLLFREVDVCSENIVLQAHEALVDQLSLLFANATEMLSASQINLLKAILSGETKLTSRAVLEKYHFSSSAHVISLKKRLIELELIDKYSGEMVFLDPMYEYWLKMCFLKLK